MLQALLAKFNTDQSLKKLVSGSGLVLFFKLSAAFGSYLFYLFLSQKFGAEKVGQFNVAFTIVSLGSVLARIGLDGALVRLIPRGLLDKAGDGIRELIKKILFIAVGNAIIIGIVVFFLKPWMMDVLDNQNLSQPILVSALLMVPYTICIMLGEMFRALENNWWFSWMQHGIIFLFVGGAGLVVAHFLEFSFIELVWFFASLFVFQALIGLFKLKISTDKLPSASDQRFPLSQVFPIALPMFLSGSAVLLMNWTDTLILAYFETEDFVGIYTIVFKVAALITLAQVAINTIAGPMISKFHKQNDIAGMARFSKQITWINISIALPVILAFIFFGDWFLKLFGSEYVVGQQALIILSFGQFSNAIAGPVMFILNMTSYEKTAKNIVMISAVLNIVFNIILIPIYGIVGAAITSAVIMALWNLASMVFIKMKLGFWTTGLVWKEKLS